VNQSRSDLRQKLRSLRNGFSDARRAGHDKAIGRYLLELVRSRRAGSIAGYWPFNGEPDITPVCRQLMADGCRLALPVIEGENAGRMEFHSWRADTDLAQNRYGIFEPQATGIIPVSNFDMLIVPLVGYDRFGNRLGMGAGYYDRCLETIRDLDTPLRVGVAYSLQEMDPAAAQEWDVPLHGVVNEHGWLPFAGRRP
jgi:5-formyltetrahydrofolate cyclo-ligase